MADNFQHCIDAADALFHARLLAEGVAREVERFRAESDCRCEAEPTDAD